ncbi:hypothetical protein C4K35_3331 [Pseudomonas chlororaphis subsp. piscium]|nr:hypothetical protein C4K35_3331 [Pseudomonas chlororaphis subsp. piscium]AZC57486.1 hypothetical protein C4K34_3321 [Pseudomonas chlororaphis subsp. piscium]AZC63712.1 hypothetical protein C4K33_3220 [Pseudomonas chlororaphis subsp. piscium]AZC69950.1 hypothetical protein C4K32_3288 [Pseudomonas chlororaphis subsp. piscium]AZC76192.1 hypothetical protein C4K31_3289 [Pseudomonas chlororaphis subsp. piscium]
MVRRGTGAGPVGVFAMLIGIVVCSFGLSFNESPPRALMALQLLGERLRARL